MDVKEDLEARIEETPLDTVPQEDEQCSSETPGLNEEIPPEQADMDEASRLKELHANVRNQDDLERDITRQVGILPWKLSWF